MPNMSLDWVFVYDLVALFGGIILGILLMGNHHHSLHMNMHGED